MDDLTAILAGSFQVSLIPNNTAAPHPRFCQYKSRTTSMNQDERRRMALELQKQKRFDFIGHVRSLAEDVWEGDSVDYAENDESEDMEVERFRRPGINYKNQLMLSEWMIEVPENFESDWLMVPCPIGKRCLVVASRNRTKSYSRFGQFLFDSHSALPGGSRHGRSSDTTVLDCIYSDFTRTYYVLDLMCWKKQTMYDAESECRFFLQRSVFQDAPEVGEVSRQNPYRFELMPYYPCDRNSIEDAMKAEMNYELDGILFYHKQAHYTFGSSPLVVWLKPYMMPEILGIQVPEKFLSKAPPSYKNFAGHVEGVKQRKIQKDLKREKRERRWRGEGEQQVQEEGEQPLKEDVEPELQEDGIQELDDKADQELRERGHVSTSTEPSMEVQSSIPTTESEAFLKEDENFQLIEYQDVAEMSHGEVQDQKVQF